MLNRRGFVRVLVGTPVVGVFVGRALASRALPGKRADNVRDMFRTIEEISNKTLPNYLVPVSSPCFTGTPTMPTPKGYTSTA